MPTLQAGPRAALVQGFMPSPEAGCSASETECHGRDLYWSMAMGRISPERIVCPLVMRSAKRGLEFA